MATKTVQRLSDGTTLSITVRTDLVQTLLIENPSRRRPVGTLAWIDGRMYYVARRQYVRITHPDYEYAATRAEAARKALAFFVQSAEATIAHAESEGIDVADCYGEV